MKKCLIIDNKSMMRKISRVQAEVLGFKVAEAEGGMIALDKCKKAMPDLIIVDWMMPEMDGIEFISELQKVVKRKKPYVVMSSAKADPEDAEEAMSAGANAYLSKPVTLKDLKGKLEEEMVI